MLRVSFLPDVGLGPASRSCATRSCASASPASPPTRTSSSAGNKEYYLATACTKIYAVPTRHPGRHRPAQRDDVLREARSTSSGCRRSSRASGSTRTRRTSSRRRASRAPHREQMEALLDSLYGSTWPAIAPGRNKTPERGAGHRSTPGPTTASRPCEAGLVDELLYEDQLRDRLKDAEPRRPRHATRRQRARVRLRQPAQGRARLRRGRDHPRREPGRPLRRPGSRARTRSPRRLRQARKDDDVKAIVLRVDSPGGSGTASDVIWREVVLASKSKPVVVSMGDVAASGGYYIAMASDAIVAQPAHHHRLHRRVRRQVQPARPLRQARHHQGDPHPRPARGPVLRLPALERRGAREVSAR